MQARKTATNICVIHMRCDLDIKNKGRINFVGYDKEFITSYYQISPPSKFSRAFFLLLNIGPRLLIKVTHMVSFLYSKFEE